MHVRRRILTFTFAIGLICGLAPTRSFGAGGTCEDVFRAPSLPTELTAKLIEQLEKTPDKRYLITRLNHDIPVVGTFAGSEMQNGVFLIRFKLEGIDSTIAVNPATASLGTAPIRMNFSEDPVRDLKASLARANEITRDISRMMYEPRPKVFKGPGLEVYGDFGSKQHSANGQVVGRILSEFDAFLKGSGFRLPEKTIVHIRDSKYAKKVTLGPYCLIAGLWSPWRGQSDTTISLLPFRDEAAIVTSPSVLAHERVHSMLAMTYRPDAFFNRPTAQSLQEAIPDFLAAHFTNSPVIAGEIAEARDLTKVLSGARGGLPVTRNIFRTDQFMSQYHNSLAYSGILWRLRETLGADRMTADLKGLLDTIAKTGGPYTGFISSTPLEIEHGNMQHFLRALARFYKNDVTAMRVIAEAANANLFTLDGLTPNRMGSAEPRANGLAGPDERPALATSAMVYSTARVTLPPATLGAIIYFVLFQDDQSH
ncbi:MAG: hypothetical protein JNJ49_16080 [Bdellovibrionaceae bacterium]|nr:hypothetical protein [Pseudobdellovibrionaceae bacterium]